MAKRHTRSHRIFRESLTPGHHVHFLARIRVITYCSQRYGRHYRRHRRRLLRALERMEQAQA